LEQAGADLGSRDDVMEQEQRSIETREAIEKVSVKLFAKQGIHATSLEEVARRAGISKGAIYWHYDSKEDLLLAVLARVRSAWRAIVLADLEEAANPKDQLRIVFRNYLSLMTEHVDITLFLQRMRLETSPSIVPIVAKFLSESADLIAGIIENGVKSHAFTRPKDINVLSYHIISALAGAHAQWLIEKSLNLKALVAEVEYGVHLRLGVASDERQTPNPKIKTLSK
jgi:TetR/AcrR family transcriptional regulator, cholesterol catabolism regulator